MAEMLETTADIYQELCWNSETLKSYLFPTMEKAHREMNAYTHDSDINQHTKDTCLSNIPTWGARKFAILCHSKIVKILEISWYLLRDILISWNSQIVQNVDFSPIKAQFRQTAEMLETTADFYQELFWISETLKSPKMLISAW